MKKDPKKIPSYLENHTDNWLDTTTSFQTSLCLKKTVSWSPHLGTKPSDCGTSEPELPPDCSKDTPRKSSPLPSLPITDKSSVPELTEKSYCGTPWETSSTKLDQNTHKTKTPSTTKTGSAKSDTPPRTKTHPRDTIFHPTSPQSAGTEDWKSGKPTCKSRLLSRLTMDTFKPSPLPPMMESTLPPEEEIENWTSGTSLICPNHPDHSIPSPRSTRSPSTQNSNGSLLPLKLESEFGTSTLPKPIHPTTLSQKSQKLTVLRSPSYPSVLL